MKLAVRKRARVLARPGARVVMTARRIAGRRPVLGHHGIQRSGTNLLRVLLDSSGYLVLNSLDPARDDPRHKHFRWQPDKATISMDSRYNNGVCVTSTSEVNAFAGYPVGTRHVVIYKHPANWLVSIARWARSNGWVPDDSDPLQDESLLRSWLKDWDAYYSFWVGLEAQQTGVAVVSYEALMADPERVLSVVHRMSGHNSPLRLPKGAHVAKVAHSSRRSADWSVPAVEPGLDELARTETTWDWPGRL